MKTSLMGARMRFTYRVRGDYDQQRHEYPMVVTGYEQGKIVIAYSNKYGCTMALACEKTGKLCYSQSLTIEHVITDAEGNDLATEPCTYCKVPMAMALDNCPSCGAGRTRDGE